MSTTIQFAVLGTPKPQGSKRHLGNGVMVEQGGEPLRLWREDVKASAVSTREVFGSLDGAIWGTFRFFLARPKSHWRTGANAHLLRDKAPRWPVTRPDLDKVLRSTCDAITTAGLWRDDAQLVHVTASLNYADERPPGVWIELTSLDPTGADQ